MYKILILVITLFIIYLALFWGLPMTSTIGYLETVAIVHIAFAGLIVLAMWISYLMDKIH